MFAPIFLKEGGLGVSGETRRFGLSELSAMLQPPLRIHRGAKKGARVFCYTRTFSELAPTVRNGF